MQAAVLEISALVLGIFLLLCEAFAGALDKRRLAYGGIFGLGLILLASFFVTAGPLQPDAVGFWSFYAADPLALFFKRFALATTMLVLIMMLESAPRIQSGLGEFFALPIFTCAGLMWMASAIDFVMIFVSLELVTMSFYVLVAYTRRNPVTLEAGVKYLILSALSTGFLVYGITWVFGVTGETSLARVAAAFSQPNLERAPALFGAVLILVGLGFKIAAVPFQIWVADVYQGAPTAVTAYLSVGSKAAGFVVLLRVLSAFFILPQVQRLLVAVAIATLIYGNLAALPQTNLKRLLGYSSIAHAGYLLVGVVSFSGAAVGFYLVSYLLMTLLSFTVLIVVANSAGGEEISDFDGLSKRSPFLALAMMISMLSLAGVPFTAGFFGKFMVFDAAIQQHQTALVVVAVVTVACGFYYYLKVIRAMYWESPARAAPIAFSQLSRVTMTGLMIAIITLGVYPQPILRALSDASHPVTAQR
ncbi:MAG: NADH-quinone oxidoreductase subunit N [Chthoniobacterales bacterium]|nr:NADH-quinone oxidoreductase subunit N [Chthoniobacterales bacterium]